MREADGSMSFSPDPAFDHPHILIGKSEMVTNFMHENMSNNRVQRDLTSRPKIEDRIPIEKNPIWQVSGRRISALNWARP